jgi:hypothetical protein
MRRVVPTALVLLALLAVLPVGTSAHAVVPDPVATTAVTKCRAQVPLIWLRMDRASCAEGKRITLAYRRHVQATHGHTGVQRISGWRCSGSFVGFDEVLLNCSKAIPHNRAKRTIRALFYWD